MRHFISVVLIVLTLSGAIFIMAGLQGRMSRNTPFEVFPDMDRQLKLRPQKPFDFMPNGVSSQLPPAGTVARNPAIQTADGAVYPFENSPVNTGKITGTTNFVATNPLRVNAQLLERGRERFNIYCAPCHGKLGDGNGITKKIGDMPAVANLHEKRIVEMPAGEIFNTITHGKGLMGAYGPLIPTKDRWAIIAYVRALQLSQIGTAAELPPDQRAAFQ